MSVRHARCGPALSRTLQSDWPKASSDRVQGPLTLHRRACTLKPGHERMGGSQCLLRLVSALPSLAGHGDRLIVILYTTHLAAFRFHNQIPVVCRCIGSAQLRRSRDCRALRNFFACTDANQLRRSWTVRAILELLPSLDETARPRDELLELCN